VKSRERRWGFEPEEVEKMGDPAMKQTSGITGTRLIQEYARQRVYITSRASRATS
jgi:hypothetical protein